MRLRPYISERDYSYVERWLGDERVHALWCAGLIPYPLTRESLDAALKKDASEWGGCAYVATQDHGVPVGFFVYSVNEAENSGFLKFVVLDHELRGRGYGTRMLGLALKYAFEITGVSKVSIRVFDVNAAAKGCYEKLGFGEAGVEERAFVFGEEVWGRCHMEVVKSP